MIKRSLVTGLVLAVVAACDSGGEDPVDPLGDWEFEVEYSTGTCNLEGNNVDLAMPVTQGPDGVLIGMSNSVVTGTVVCDSASCVMEATATRTDVDPENPSSSCTTSVTVNLTLDADSTITGTGTYDVVCTDPAVGSCSQMFTVPVGRRN